MIFNEKGEEWRLINYRNIDDVTSAEFLHDLYNQHKPILNPIRFRNIISFYEGNIFKSYAPTSEWDQIGAMVGEKFYNLEKEFLSMLDDYIEKDKNIVLRKIEATHKLKLSRESNKSLVDKFFEIHYLALSEIYEINLVQIEQGLYYALKKSLKTNYPEEVANLYFVSLLGEGQSIINKSDYMILNLSILVSKGLIDIKTAVEQYNEKFKDIGMAYGDRSNALDILNILKEKMKVSIEDREKIKNKLQKNLDKKNKAENLEIIKLDNRLRRLYSYCTKISELRDTNKALMGKVSALKNKILIEIAIKNNISREDISRYTLNDLYFLSREGKKVDKNIIKKRYKKLVLVREDNIGGENQFNKNEKIVFNKKEYNQHKYKGISVNKGIVEGIVKHVYSSKDIENITPQDIIVAKGTDFNMIEAMLRSKGFIVEEGGVLSHASIVAREIGKPCIIGISDIFNRIPNNSKVLLNADEGVVTILKDFLEEIKILSNDNLDPKIYGEKASRLSKLLRSGFNVLDGIAISTRCKELLLTDEFLDALINTINENLSNIETLIVRSSSPSEDSKYKSVAGVFESIVCSNNKKSLKEALRKVIESSNLNGAKEYLQMNEIEMAILIQPYLKCDVGGVVFTQNILSKNSKDEILVEASFCGASNVVNGKVDIRDKISINTENKNAIYEKLRIETIKIKKVFKFECDIEWGICNDTLYIFQVRPITTLKSYNQ